MVWSKAAIPSDGPRRFACIETPSFKRSLFGYRPSAVDREIAERERALREAGGRVEVVEAQVGRLEAEVESSREVAAARQRRNELLEAELQLARGEAARSARGLARVGLELEELTVAARARASRLRLDALRDAAAVAARVKAIAGADPENADRLLAALEQAVERVAAEIEPEDAGSGLGNESIDRDRGRQAADSTGPSLAPAAGGSLNGGSEDVDGRSVSVDIGPFKDFSQLIRFEDAANAIGATEEISIRRFSEGRANIDVSLSEPIDLLRELEQSCELEFEVRRADRGEIILDVGE